MTEKSNTFVQLNDDELNKSIERQIEELNKELDNINLFSTEKGWAISICTLAKYKTPLEFALQEKRERENKLFLKTSKSYAKSAQIASWVAAISMVVQIIVLIYK